MTEQLLVSAASGKIGTAIFAFEESLTVVHTLTASQRRAIAKAAGALVQECMQIQSELNVALVRRALDW